MTFVIPPAAQPSVEVAGTDARFPVHRIYCVGRNYAAHAREMGMDPDRDPPFFFSKPADAVVANGTPVPYPPRTANLHHEIELVVAIGKGGRDIPLASALDHVYGYACGLDMTRRDLQAVAKEQRRPWDLGKDFEQAAVLSEIVPAADVAPPGAGRIELRVNGTVRQSSDLSLLIHPVPAVIAHLSRYYTLQPGDLIYTGTPEGVGPVVAGDVLEGSIEGVGTISLKVGQMGSEL